MDSDRSLELFGIAFASVLLLVITAAEAGVIHVSRSRARGSNGSNGAALPDTLQRYMHERAALLSALRFGRNVAIILGVASAVHLVVARFGGDWPVVLLTAVGALLVIGLIEGIPEVVVARDPERWARVCAPITRLLGAIFALPSALVDLPGTLIARLTPRPMPAPAEEQQEELLRLVEMEKPTGGFEKEERQMIRGVIRLVDTTAREIMVPRIDIVAVPTTATIEDVQRIVLDRGFSRIPLYEDSIDNIVGIIHAKDVLRALGKDARTVSLKELAREAYFVPETKKVDELLSELRQGRRQIAIVGDEYGGTAGLVTTEDIIEEIVGEIEDEYDVEEQQVERLDDGSAIVDARVSIDVLNDLFGLDLDDTDYDTVGGIVFSELGKLPAPDDEVRVDGVLLHVLSVNGRRIKKVRVQKLETAPVEP